MELSKQVSRSLARCLRPLQGALEAHLKTSDTPAVSQMRNWHLQFAGVICWAPNAEFDNAIISLLLPSIPFLSHLKSSGDFTAFDSAPWS